MDGQIQLHAFRGRPPGPRHHAGVVHQYVDPIGGGRNLLRHPLNAFQDGDVRGDHGRSGDFAGKAGGTTRIPADQEQAMTIRGELPSHVPPESRGGADQNDGPRRTRRPGSLLRRGGHRAASTLMPFSPEAVTSNLSRSRAGRVVKMPMLRALPTR